MSAKLASALIELPYLARKDPRCHRAWIVNNVRDGLGYSLDLAPSDSESRPLGAIERPEAWIAEMIFDPETQDTRWEFHPDHEVELSEVLSTIRKVGPDLFTSPYLTADQVHASPHAVAFDSP